MRKIKFPVSAIVFAGFLSVSLAAQQPTPSPTVSTPQSAPSQPAQATPVPSTASASEVANQQLRPVTGELEKKLDSKNAKPGDPVIVKTTKRATTADGIVIPKGSRIVGHVTDVQPHSKTNPNARLTIQFDQAEIKGGQTLPIRSVLERVAPPPDTDQPTDELNAMPSPIGAPGGMAGASGGVITGSPRGASPAGGEAQSPSTVTGMPPMSAQTGNQAAKAARKAGTVVARQGNVDIETTAVPGVLLATNASGQPFSNAAGELLGAKRNVHLDGGTEIVLAVMDAPQKPGTR